MNQKLLFMKKRIYLALKLFLSMTILSFWSFYGFSQTANPVKNLKAVTHNTIWNDVVLTWDAPDKITSSDYIPTEITEIFNNGPYISIKGVGYNGADVNCVGENQLLIGVNIIYDSAKVGYHQFSSDDFTLDVPTKITSVDHFFTVEGKGSQNTAGDGDILYAYVAIFDTNPGLYPQATPIWGDFATNRANSIVFQNAYATRSSNFEDTRFPIFKVNLAVNDSLPAGKYWIGFGMLPKERGSTTPISILVRNPNGGSSGDAWNIRNNNSEQIKDNMYNFDTYGIPFSINGLAYGKIVKGYEVFRNDSSIYNKKDLTTFCMDIVPDTGIYRYDIVSHWNDSSSSQKVSTVVHMEENPCLTPFSYRDLNLDFEEKFPQLNKCWEISAKGAAHIKQTYSSVNELYMSPECNPHGGDRMLTYFSDISYAGDTGWLISPDFYTENKKFTLSFWLYRDNGFKDNLDHLNVYCISPEDTLRNKTPLLTIHRSTEQSPKTAIANTGWYQHSVAIDCADLPKGKLYFEFVADMGGNLYIDDITITDSSISRNCEAPANPQVAYTESSAKIAWDEPGFFNNNTGEIGYGFEITPNALGQSNTYSMTIAIRWDTTDLKNLGFVNGTLLKNISFVPSFKTKQDAKYTLKVWQSGSVKGSDYDKIITPGKLIYSQAVEENEISLADWTTIDFEMPVEIDPKKELWFGVECAVLKNKSMGPFRSDNGPLLYSKGNLMTGSDLENQWAFALDFDHNYFFNWCLKGGVEIPNTKFRIPRDPSSKVIGYNLYKDGEPLAEGLTSLSYTDHAANENNKHNYTVSALYNTYCESPEVQVSLWTPTSNHKNMEMNTFHVYPNPTDHILYISGKDIKKIEIYNTIGKLIMSSQVLNNQLNLTDYVSGIYFIKIIDATGYTETKQVIVRH